MRRVGHAHYTREFAEILFREALLCRGRARTIRDRLVCRAREFGNPLWHLLPRKVAFWLAILEDLFASRLVLNRYNGLLQECFDKKEFLHVSIDATLRCAMRVKGQANDRSARSDRLPHIQTL